MSIPSIRFAKNRNIKPLASKPLQQNSKLKFTISSSSYSYSDFDDDIPMLDSLNKQSNQPAFLSSESLESDQEFSAKEEDWKAKKNPAQINNNNLQKKNNIKDRQIERKIRNDDLSEGSNNENVFQINQTKNTSTTNSKKQDDPVPIQNNQQLLNQSQSENLVINNNNNNNDNTTNYIPEKEPVASNSAKTVSEQVSSKISSFYVFRQPSSFSSKKNKFRMEENSKAVFFASESKDYKGKIFVITESNIIPQTETVGIVRINSSHNIFTIITNEEKFNDDREGELCGVELCGEIVHQSSKYKYKKIRLVLPKNGKPYYPIAHRKSFSKIIQIRKNLDKNLITFKNSQNIEDDSTPSVNDASLHLEKFNFYETTDPSDESDTSEEMSKLLINPNSKNFIIRGADGKVMLMFYKFSSGSFNVSFRLPITPIVAFGISISVLSSSNKRKKSK